MKKLMILITLASLVLINPVFAIKITDIPNDWSKEAVETAIERGILSADVTGVVRPTDMLTRAEMAYGMNRIFSNGEKADLTGYNDVPQNEWYYDEMRKAVATGYFSGYGDGTLKPASQITRQEMFMALAKALKLTDGNEKSLNQFADEDLIAAWAIGKTSAMVENKYISGNADGTLNPIGNISRKEFAQIMKNIENTYDVKNIYKTTTTFTWDTTNQMKKTINWGGYDKRIKIDWGNGEVEYDISANDNNEVIYKYEKEGKYVVTIYGGEALTLKGNQITEMNPDGMYIAIDCSDNNIEELNIDYVSLLDCSNNMLKKINIKNTIFHTLNCNNNQLEELEWDKMKDIRAINCSNNKLKSMDLSGYTNLEELNCSNNKLSELLLHKKGVEEYMYEAELNEANLNACNNLKKLNCEQNELKELDISLSHKLSTLICNNNKLQKLKLSIHPELYELYCANNELQELDVSWCENLGILECNDNNLVILMHDNPKISWLYCQNNKLETLDLSGYKELERFSCNNNDLSELNLNGCRLMWILSCNENKLTVLDISDCKNMSAASCEGNNLKTVVIKKGQGPKIYAPDVSDEFKIIYDDSASTAEDYFGIHSRNMCYVPFMEATESLLLSEDNLENDKVYLDLDGDSILDKIELYECDESNSTAKLKINDTEYDIKTYMGGFYFIDICKNDKYIEIINYDMTYGLDYKQDNMYRYDGNEVHKVYEFTVDDMTF